MIAAHPRVSGENQKSLPSITRPSGSSPREQGKPALSVGKSDNIRLIPA